MALKNSSIKYQIGAMIGCGGMAEVFCGEALGEEGFRRSVAIKRIRPHLSHDPGVVSFFKQEAALCARLEHPNIVSVLDFIRDEEDRFLLVMERVDGIELRQLMNAGSLPWELAQHVFRRILGALECAHAHDIVHCDVTPRNILITRCGIIKLSDFGLARVMAAAEASQGAARGTLGYVSPEILQGQVVDHRADLYSAGAVIYELLTGQTAYEQGSAAAWQNIFANEKPLVPARALRPEIPEQLDAVITQLLARDPADRFASARDALAALPTAHDLTSDLASFANIRRVDTRDEFHSFREALRRQAQHVMEQAQRDKGNTQPACRGTQLGSGHAEMYSGDGRDALVLPYVQTGQERADQDSHSPEPLSGEPHRNRSAAITRLGYDMMCITIALALSASVALAPEHYGPRFSPTEQRQAPAGDPSPSLPVVAAPAQISRLEGANPQAGMLHVMYSIDQVLSEVRNPERKPVRCVKSAQRPRNQRLQNNAHVQGTSDTHGQTPLIAEKHKSEGWPGNPMNYDLGMPSRMGNEVSSKSKKSTATE